MMIINLKALPQSLNKPFCEMAFMKNQQRERERIMKTPRMAVILIHSHSQKKLPEIYTPAT